MNDNILPCPMCGHGVSSAAQITSCPNCMHPFNASTWRNESAMKYREMAERMNRTMRELNEKWIASAPRSSITCPICGKLLSTLYSAIEYNGLKCCYCRGQAIEKPRIKCGGCESYAEFTNSDGVYICGNCG